MTEKFPMECLGQDFSGHSKRLTVNFRTMAKCLVPSKSSGTLPRNHSKLNFSQLFCTAKELMGTPDAAERYPHLNSLLLLR